MARIQVLKTGEVLEATAAYDGNESWWEAGARDFSPHLVRVLGRHEGEYNPNHWGELDPDAYDRLGYLNPHDGTEDDYQPHGRHLLHTGVE